SPSPGGIFRGIRVPQGFLGGSSAPRGSANQNLHLKTAAVAEPGAPGWRAGGAGLASPRARSWAVLLGGMSWPSWTGWMGSCLREARTAAMSDALEPAREKVRQLAGELACRRERVAAITRELTEVEARLVAAGEVGKGDLAALGTLRLALHRVIAD